MKALILAAGYATRLYPLTLNKAKPLLPVAKKAVIDHIIDRIEEISDVDEIMVVTNDKFFKQFEQWRKNFAANRPVKVKILNDRSLTEEDRLGAIGDMELVIRQENINDDLLVVAGDNLFQGGMVEFVEFAKSRLSASSIGLYNIEDRNDVRRYSQVVLGENNRVIDFEEKPESPTSNLVAKCLYFFPADKLKLIKKYLSCNGQIDAPGHYIKWLSREDFVYGFIFSGKWYDIGDLKTYKKADGEFASL